MRLLLFLLTLIFPGWAMAEGVIVLDDTGREIRLEQPAERVIALAPHLTELVFELGAEHRLVAVGAHSDYPAAASALPQVGSAQRLDIESILAQSPDLVLAWDSGNVQRALRQLESHGIPVYRSEPRRLEQVADNLRALGVLLGRRDSGQQLAAAFEEELGRLGRIYADRAPVAVFYQIWDQPVMTVNGEHLISEALQLCGGRNVFADLPRLTPRLDAEAVLERDPEVMLASAEPGGADPLARWRGHTGLTATERGNLLLLPPDLLVRPSSRVLQGVAALCEALHQARLRRPVH